MTTLIHDEPTYILVSAIGRFMQGIGVGGVLASCFSMIKVLFSNQYCQTVSKFNLSLAIGISIGPLLGHLISLIKEDN